MYINTTIKKLMSRQPFKNIVSVLIIKDKDIT